jgi:NADH dehydrogenase (ubiquinone) 1 beta subcomplex subunit 10
LVREGNIDRAAVLEDKERFMKEQLVRTQEITIIREKLKWCYRREGVNHLENCREIANQYLDLISAIKSGWFKAYSPK